MKFYRVLFAIVIIFVAVLVLRPNSLNLQANQATSVQALNSLVGKPAPNFTLTDQNGKIFSLSQQRGHKVVLFFNEGIMCYPACWNQMAALGTDSQLNSLNVVSASIVVDSKADWGQAFHKMPELAKSTILFDSDSSVSTLYNMLSLPSSMHKGMKPGHTYILIDANGIVRYVKDDPSMGIQNKVLTQELTKL